jgi:hypothetical protein
MASGVRLLGAKSLNRLVACAVKRRSQPVLFGGGQSPDVPQEVRLELHAPDE